MENTMYAGFHCVEVQPPLGLNIPGYYHARYAQGTADPLYLRAAAFSCGEEFELYHENELHYFYPKENRRQAARWVWRRRCRR